MITTAQHKVSHERTRCLLRPAFSHSGAGWRFSYHSVPSSQVRKTQEKIPGGYLVSTEHEREWPECYKILCAPILFLVTNSSSPGPPRSRIFQVHLRKGFASAASGPASLDSLKVLRGFLSLKEAHGVRT